MPAKSSSSGLGPPAVDAFAAYPASWYLFCESRQLRREPFSRNVLGRRLVAFRTAGGRVAVMDAHCAHLGADLGHGRVVGETIECPFHQWRYRPDGVCAAVPNLDRAPAFARLRTYPAVERHGYLFFFNGAEPLFPLPFLLGEAAEDYVAGKVFRYVADCTWYMNSAHAFDRQHFAAVHDRELLAPPAIDCPAPFARRNSYPARIVGRTLLDRVLRAVAGRTVKITLTIWGGTLAVITADYERLRSGFIIAMEPLADGCTLCQGIVLARRAASPLRLLDACRLGARTLFTHGYLKEEARRLRGTRYRPRSLGVNDQEMIDFFRWVATLPQAGPEPREPETSEGDHDQIERSPAVAAVGGGRAGVVASAAGQGGGGS
ncbi:MAG TPA: Rieske 2Fe-2S domain-containing protein [Thermoanaerobaculia bacterium]|jgi:nitrite reductase/ring-hydroxylating ferredoxin subunit|nr:Rieske 2Fe-2S domain-containing protein [Thermoanaerobaculia bacterium]